jgi:hypothetical protein
LRLMARLRLSRWGGHLIPWKASPNIGIEPQMSIPPCRNVGNVTLSAKPAGLSD